MKKFIAAFDSLNFNESTLRYALFLTRQSGAHLVGVFLEDYNRRSYGLREIARYEGVDRDSFVRQLDTKDREVRKESIETFERACELAGVPYSIHRDRNIALQEILEESIYADLLVIGAEETMTNEEEPVPTRFIRDLLLDVQCPVVLVPSLYRPVNKLVLLYDGELSSVHAVRAFSYLFDACETFETEVVTVKQPNETAYLPHNRLTREFIKRHYPKAEYKTLKGEAEEEIIGYLKQDKSQPLLILGAYRRSRMSRLFRASMADQLLENLQLPLFIAPNKS